MRKKLEGKVLRYLYEVYDTRLHAVAIPTGAVDFLLLPELVEEAKRIQDCARRSENERAGSRKQNTQGVFSHEAYRAVLEPKLKSRAGKEESQKPAGSVISPHMTRH